MNQSTIKKGQLIEEKPRQTTVTHYEIVVGEGPFASTLLPENWTQYYKRLSLSLDNQLEPNQVYGLDQVREHIKEVRQTTGEYAQYWRSVHLSIRKLTTTTEIIE